MCLQSGEQTWGLLGKMGEAQLLDLRDGEALPRLLVSLAVGVDRLFRRHREERAPDAENLFSEFGGIASGTRGEVLEDATIDWSGSGRGKIQRVRDQTCHEDPRDLPGDLNSSVLVRERDERRGGPYRVVPEEHRRVAGEAAEFMVIEHLNDRHLVGAAHSLAEFIVIDQNELSRDFL